MSSLYWNHTSEHWKYISEITRAIAEHLDLESVLARALRYAVQLANGEAGLIALRDADGRFHFAARERIEPSWLPALEPLLVEVPQTLKEGARRWQFPELAVKLETPSRQQLPFGYIMAIPLVATRQLVGVIYVLRSPAAMAFTTIEQDAFGSFADHVAVAIQNAQLYSEVQQRATELEAILEGSTNGLILAEPTGRVRNFNRAAEGLTGWPPSLAQNLGLDQIVRLRDEQGDLLALPILTDGRQPVFVADGFLERRDGSKGAFAHVILAPLYREQGTLLSIVCSIVDLTRLREAEDLKTAFLAGISHDLKTPLALIRGYAETMRNPDVKLDRKVLDSSLAIIEDETQYLTNLVNALLDAAQLQVGRLSLSRVPVRIDEMAVKIVNRFQGAGSTRRWSLSFPPDFPAVEADPERVREVLQNLMTNAQKYSPADGEIEVGGWVEPERVGIYVRDHGPGVPVEEQARIFDRFARGRGEWTRRQRGAGLGLYLSRAIVEQHGGKIWVENMPERGAIFYFTLPRGET